MQSTFARRDSWLSLIAATLVVTAATLLMNVLPASAGSRPFGDAQVLTQVPADPGFPEGIAVKGNRVYVAGPATFGTTGKPASKVFAFDRNTGELLNTYPTQGENTLLEHANSSIAFDAEGRLYVLNTQLGMYRLVFEENHNAQQQPYGNPFPDLPPCLPVPVVQPCSPTPNNNPPIPNDLAFDAAGNAYVTDSMQATIWRVPKGGGEPQVWFQDSRLASSYIGPNGIRINPAGNKVYFSVTTDMQGAAHIYTLPLKANPLASDLKVFHTYGLDEGPDGIAFGATGRLYVALALPTKSGISILTSTGAEETQLLNPNPLGLEPYDSPANIAFSSAGTIVVTNHAFVSGVLFPEKFRVLDVFVDDPGAVLFKPSIP
jgi:sugar lactone lactonase YvrE